MKTGRRGFLETAGLTIAGLWTLVGGLAKINGVRAFFESLASLRGPVRVGLFWNPDDSVPFWTGDDDVKFWGRAA